MAAKQEFESRFAKHKDELEWLFMELYHNREGLEVLEREMAEAYNARSAELKALDKARSADPEWYKRGNMFGMTMYTDLFAGNLKELAKKFGWSIGKKKSGIQKGLDDIKAGRIYRAKDMNDLKQHLLG